MLWELSWPVKSTETQYARADRLHPVPVRGAWGWKFSSPHLKHAVKACVWSAPLGLHLRLSARLVSLVRYIAPSLQGTRDTDPPSRVQSMCSRALHPHPQHTLSTFSLTLLLLADNNF